MPALVHWLALLAIVGSLGACALAPPANPPAPQGNPAPTSAPAPLPQGISRWVPVPWSQLELERDTIEEAWPAWLLSCERPLPAWRPLCPEIRRLADAGAQAQRAFLHEKLQPFRVETDNAQAQGLLTGYYEPVMTASRRPQGRFTVPLYAPPAALAARKPWFTRQEIDTLPQARAELKGRELVYLADPVDALVVQIQGSGLMQVTEADGQRRLVRLAFAGTNEQPYRSVGRWLLDRGLVRDASWPGIKDWIHRNPARVQELLWSNPRVVFFREEALPAGRPPAGPRGAQGVALTAGRSIAVDPRSIPYGTPVWLSSSGPLVQLQRLVLAQDTGSAIVGAVRADYYAGSGDAAGELAGRLKQPLRMWALWPRQGTHRQADQ
jgi:membrane-bound lytic murein transglycosylase A